MKIDDDKLLAFVTGELEIIILEKEATFSMRHYQNKTLEVFLNLFGIDHRTPEIGVVKNEKTFDFFYLSRQPPGGSGSPENLEFLNNELAWFKKLMLENVEGIEFITATYDHRRPSPFGVIGSARSLKAALEIINEEKNGLHAGSAFVRARNAGGKHYVCVCDPGHLEYVTGKLDRFGIEYEITT